jgi:filamentous hemagglutinin family protein
MCVFKFGIATAPSLLFYSIALTAQAQILPDTTLPTNSIASPDGNTSIITGGTQAGENLFHSFEQFSIPTGTGAYFNSAIEIQNIFSRVTGSSISNIDGFIRANGTANLFLLNPNGIIFGPNASLDLGGSFVGSTADRLLFQDGSFYSATETQTVPLLTINVPIGLQFGINPGAIVNRSRAFNSATNAISGLQVTSGNTLALVGGNINVEGGRMRAIDGRLEVGSVGANSRVDLTAQDNLFTLGYAEVRDFQDIRLSQQAQIAVADRGRGELNIQGRNILLTESSVIRMENTGSSVGGNITIRSSDTVTLNNASRIRIELFSLGQSGRLTLETGQLVMNGASTVAAQTVSAGRGGTIAIRANSIELSGTDPFAALVTEISTSARSTGDVGDIEIETDRLSLQNGAQIGASTSNSGDAGNIAIRANSIELRGTTTILEPLALNPIRSFRSRILAETEGAGNGGTITIESDRLSITDGAGVLVGTLGAGNGGTITIETDRLLVADGAGVAAVATGSGQAGNIRIRADSIELSGQPTDRSPGTNLSSFLTAATANKGNAGNIEIDTDELTVRDGASINVGTIGMGNAGNMTIRANSIELDSQALRPSGENSSSALNAGTLGSGNAGSILIETEELRVQNSARVFVSSTRSGNPGNVRVSADVLRLDNQGNIDASSATGRGGNIDLTARSIQLRRQSFLTAGGSSTLPTPEGNINTNAETLVLLEGSRIFTDAADPQGGSNITLAGLDEPVVVIQSRDSLIDARGTLTIAGEINPNTTDLPQIEVPDVTRLLSGGCRDYQGSSFYVTGRGGIPESPYDLFDGSAASDRTWVELPDLAGVEASSIDPNSLPTRSAETPAPFIEAQGWTIGKEGEVILTATPQTSVPNSPAIPVATCFR